MDNLFNADVDGVILQERVPGKFFVMNTNTSGGLSVEFSRAELTVLRFLIEQQYEGDKDNDA